MYNFIVDPYTNQKASINSKLGKQILKKYFTYIVGGSDLTPDFIRRLEHTSPDNRGSRSRRSRSRSRSRNGSGTPEDRGIGDRGSGERGIGDRGSGERGSRTPEFIGKWEKNLGYGPPPYWSPPIPGPSRSYQNHDENTVIDPDTLPKILKELEERKKKYNDTIQKLLSHKSDQSSDETTKISDEKLILLKQNRDEQKKRIKYIVEKIRTEAVRLLHIVAENIILVRD